MLPSISHNKDIPTLLINLAVSKCSWRVRSGIFQNISEPQQDNFTKNYVNSSSETLLQAKKN